MEKVAPRFDHLTTLAKTVAVPRLHKPQRMPTFPALERTAILGFTDTNTISIDANTSGILQVVVCRDPIYPMWITQVMPVEFSVYTNFTVPTLGSGVPANGTLVLTGDSEVHNLNGVAPRNIKPIIKHNGLEYIPAYSMSSRINLGIQLQANATMGSYRVDFAILYADNAGWEVKNFTRSGTLQFNGTNTYGSPMTFTPEFTGAIIGVRITELALTAGGAAANVSAVAVGITTTYPGAAALDQARCLEFPIGISPPGIGLMPWVPPPAISDSSMPYRACRATALAVLFSNVTKTLNKEGTVQGARVSLSSFPVWSPTEWSYGDIHPTDRYFGPLEKGLYTFTLADTQSDEFVDCVNRVGEVFNVDGFQYANILTFADPDSATASTLAVTLDRHIEFRTSSLLFTTGYSTETLEVYHQAQLALLKMGCIMENPSHLATIASMAAQAVKSAWPYLKPTAIHLGQQAVNTAAKWANKKLGAMSQAQMVVPKSNNRKKITRPKPKAKR